MMNEKCTAIVLAAGQGKRMKSKIQKQFLLIKEKPVLFYSISCFQECPFIDEVIIVTAKESITFCGEEIVKKYGFTKVHQIVAGGKERYDSVYQGLLAAKECDYVFIHDGARPFITQAILQRALEAVREYQACVVGMPSKDTIKIADDNHMVLSTPNRKNVWNIQTPQVFSYPLILNAHRDIRKRSLENITDDAMVVESVTQCSIKLVEGSYENIKITTPEDISVAEGFLSSLKG